MGSCLSGLSCRPLASASKRRLDAAGRDSVIVLSTKGLWPRSWILGLAAPSVASRVPSWLVRYILTREHGMAQNGQNGTPAYQRIRGVIWKRIEAGHFRPERWKPTLPNPAFQKARPDDTFWAARLARHGERAMTPEESAEFWREHGPHMLPPDGEG